MTTPMTLEATRADIHLYAHASAELSHLHLLRTWEAAIDAAIREREEQAKVLERLKALINVPETNAFLRGAHIEAVHQVERWGTAHDRAKRPADWFWLVGYLAGKTLHAAADGDVEKAKHHTISTAAALYNWHCAITGTDVRMCPGRSDLAQMVDGIFPTEAAMGEKA